MNVLAATLRTFDLALFIFRKGQRGFKRLLAIFAVKLIAGHRYPRGTSEGWAVSNGCTPVQRPMSMQGYALILSALRRSLPFGWTTAARIFECPFV